MFEVLGGALKTLHENGIASVRYFGVRSDAQYFTIADLRHAVAFRKAWIARVCPPGVINELPLVGDEAEFQATCKEMIELGMLVPKFSNYQDQEFLVRLLPAYFEKRWQFVRQLGGGGQSRTFEVQQKSDNLKGVLKMTAQQLSVSVARLIL